MSLDIISPVSLILKLRDARERAAITNHARDTQHEEKHFTSTYRDDRIMMQPFRIYGRDIFLHAGSYTLDCAEFISIRVPRDSFGIALI